MKKQAILFLGIQICGVLIADPSRVEQEVAQEFETLATRAEKGAQKAVPNKMFDQALSLLDPNKENLTKKVEDEKKKRKVLDSALSTLISAEKEQKKQPIPRKSDKKQSLQLDEQGNPIERKSLQQAGLLPDDLPAGFPAGAIRQELPPLQPPLYDAEIVPKRVKKIKEPKTVYTGRMNNVMFCEGNKDKVLAVPFNFVASFASQGFNACKQGVPLGNLVFNLDTSFNTLNKNSFTVGDIFLESRLSALPATMGAPLSDPQGLLFIDSRGPGQFTSPANQFGNIRQQQYLALLAPVEIKFDAEYREFTAQLGFIYRVFLGEDDKVALAFGVNVPVVSRTNQLCMNIVGGKLFDEVGFAAQDATVRESTIQRFYNEFSDLEDFFQRAVLLPKNLTYTPTQHKLGFGDVALYFVADFASKINHVDALQFGINFLFPTSGPPNGNTIWEAQIGSGGAFQVDLFSNLIFNSGVAPINPTVYMAANFSMGRTGRARVPQLVSHQAVVSSTPGVNLADPANRVTNIPNLVAPVFRNYFALSFSQLDSRVPFFADSSVVAKFRSGTKLIVGVGNYFYNIFDCPFRLGLFFDFMCKAKDEVTPNCDQSVNFQTSVLTCNSDAYAQRLGWNLTYRAGCCGEFTVGSQHVLGGKNTARTNEFFFLFVARF